MEPVQQHRSSGRKQIRYGQLLLLGVARRIEALLDLLGEKSEELIQETLRLPQAQAGIGNMVESLEGYKNYFVNNMISAQHRSKMAVELFATVNETELRELDQQLSTVVAELGIPTAAIMSAEEYAAELVPGRTTSGETGDQPVEVQHFAAHADEIAQMQTMLTQLVSVSQLSSDSWLQRDVHTLPAQIREQRQAYNRRAMDGSAILPQTVAAYGGGRLTGAFEDPDYRDEHGQDPHPGVDFVSEVGAGFVTPFYTRFEGEELSQGSHPFVLLIIGTTYRIRVKHADREAVAHLRERKSAEGEVIFTPGEEIVPYPLEKNPPGTAIHFHVEVRDKARGDTSESMVNPLGFTQGTAEQYLFDYSGGDSDEPDWRDMSYRW